MQGRVRNAINIGSNPKVRTREKIRVYKNDRIWSHGDTASLKIMGNFLLSLAQCLGAFTLKNFKQPSSPLIAGIHI